MAPTLPSSPRGKGPANPGSPGASPTKLVKSMPSSPMKTMKSFFEKKSNRVAPTWDGALTVESAYHFQFPGTSRDAVNDRALQEFARDTNSIVTALTSFQNSLASLELQDARTIHSQIGNAAAQTRIIATSVKSIAEAYARIGNVIGGFDQAFFEAYKKSTTKTVAEHGGQSVSDIVHSPLRLLSYMRHFVHVTGNRTEMRRPDTLLKTLGDAIGNMLATEEAKLFNNMAELELLLGVNDLGCLSVALPSAGEEAEQHERICLQLTKPRANDLRGLPQRIVSTVHSNGKDNGPESPVYILDDAILVTEPAHGASLLDRVLSHPKAGDSFKLKYPPFSKQNLHITDLRDVTNTKHLIAMRDETVGFVQVFQVKSKADKNAVLSNMKAHGYKVVEDEDPVEKKLQMAILAKAGYFYLNNPDLIANHSNPLARRWATYDKDKATDFVAQYPLSFCAVKDAEAKSGWRKMPDMQAVLYLTADQSFFVTFQDGPTQVARFSMRLPPPFGYTANERAVYLKVHDLRGTGTAEDEQVVTIACTFELQSDRQLFEAACGGTFSAFNDMVHEIARKRTFSSDDLNTGAILETIPQTEVAAAAAGEATVPNVSRAEQEESEAPKALAAEPLLAPAPVEQQRPLFSFPHIGTTQETPAPFSFVIPAHNGAIPQLFSQGDAVLPDQARGLFDDAPEDRALTAAAFSAPPVPATSFTFGPISLPPLTGAFASPSTTLDVSPAKDAGKVNTSSAMFEPDTEGLAVASTVPFPGFVDRISFPDAAQNEVPLRITAPEQAHKASEGEVMGMDELGARSIVELDQETMDAPDADKRESLAFMSEEDSRALLATVDGAAGGIDEPPQIKAELPAFSFANHPSEMTLGSVASLATRELAAASDGGSDINELPKWRQNLRHVDKDAGKTKIALALESARIRIHKRFEALQLRVDQLEEENATLRRELVQKTEAYLDLKNDAEVLKLENWDLRDQVKEYAERYESLQGRVAWLDVAKPSEA
ncbi:hypothetical protein DFJ74DRAFT_654882 [Hyaloraphidium curvatum]|nr:hypothetical protein DFJ74DRAFT_654882 [Hyaloraphidium curvatum]